MNFLQDRRVLWGGAVIIFLVLCAVVVRLAGWRDATSAVKHYSVLPGRLRPT